MWEVIEGAHLSWASSARIALSASEATTEPFYPRYPDFVASRERARTASGDYFVRSTGLKAEYAPENRFHSDQNADLTSGVR